jgi:acetyl-CoA acetyltransferase
MIGAKVMKQAVILSAARTALGKFGGALSQVTDRTLAVLVIKEAITRAVSPGPGGGTRLSSNIARTAA